MNQLNRETMTECLRELSDRRIQETLWQGKVTGLQSDFVEARERLFTDTGLGSELEKGSTGFSTLIEQKLNDLRDQLSKVKNHHDLDDPAMPVVRELASEILAMVGDETLAR